MLANNSIAFIGGGNMAEALIRGLVDAGTKATNIRVSDPSEARRAKLRETYAIGTSANNLETAEWADIVLLAVKPQVLPTVLAALRPASSPDRLFISVAAGASIAAIETGLGKDPRVIRAMPNTPALVKAGATALAHGAHAKPGDIDIAHAIFGAVGISEELAENQLDAVTGLSGSGPAYVFVMLEAMADAGVKVGLPRPVALKLAAQTVMGSAKLLLDTNGHPGQLKDMVTSPGGTTIAGLHALEEGGLRTALINAVEAATRRANELGKQA